MFDDLCVTVGTSNNEDSFSAGVEAAKAALTDREHPPEALLVFGSCRFEHRKLLEGIASVTGSLPMVGGTTAGEISTCGFGTESVVLMALSSSVLSFATGIGKRMSDDEKACGGALVQDLKTKASLEDALTLVVFPNGMGGDGARVIEGLHEEAETPLEIVGGFLGDEFRFDSTFQFYDGEVYRDTMPGLLISGTDRYRTGIGVCSGFESIGNRFYCTNAEGNTVREFDNTPALDLYKEFLGEERSGRLPGVCLEYPFGLIDRKVSVAGKEYFQLRCGLQVNEEEKSITLAASIPEGAAITLTTASRGDIINGARLATEQAMDSLNGATPRAVLVFSCVGRRVVLGRRTGEEIEAVKKVLGRSVPLVGFYTYGEIGPIDKTQEALAGTRFHNETVVVWILGETE
ncbi:MAG: hypothetical protein DRJ65_05785 [Acidobacteria bacterium]|nr:MAG: hypothetical protein DRJ65_05785 [Acidobacteriota bacterium]